MVLYRRMITVDDKALTSGSALTLKQSTIPNNASSSNRGSGSKHAIRLTVWTVANANAGGAMPRKRRAKSFRRGVGYVLLREIVLMLVLSRSGMT